MTTNENVAFTIAHALCIISEPIKASLLFLFSEIAIRPKGGKENAQLRNYVHFKSRLR